LSKLRAWAYNNHPDLVRIFQLIRYEFSGRIAHVMGRLSPRQRRFVAELRNQRGIKVNFASGGVKKLGWVDIDAASTASIKMDLRKKVPIDDNSVKYIFCEHFCDHLSYPNMINRFLGECHRILEIGGRARFVMHDGKDLARAYADNDASYFNGTDMPGASSTEIVNTLYRFNDFHQFIYDFETFARLLKKAGFSTVIRSEYLKSECPDLVLDYELDSRKVMSMYIEAVK
jgi:predicted SAM-dependent methyltransferase